MSQTFRSLSDILRGARRQQEPARAGHDRGTESAHAISERGDDTVADSVAVAETLRAPAPQTHISQTSNWCSSLALVRLAAKEAYERSAQRLLRALACDVLVRELALEPVDITALLRKSIDAFSSDQPVAIALSPVDADRVSCEVPIRSDATLEAGDLVLVVRDGTIETTLGFRVDVALDEALL